MKLFLNLSTIFACNHFRPDVFTTSRKETIEDVRGFQGDTIKTRLEIWKTLRDGPRAVVYLELNAAKTGKLSKHTIMVGL